MQASLHLRYALWELRGGAHRLLYFVLCLAVGVAAVVVVGGLVAAFDEGIRDQARELLAADLVVNARSEPGSEVFDAIDAIPGARRTQVRELLTVVAAPSNGGLAGSRLVELKVLDGPYPFYGELQLTPAGTLDDLLDETSVVVAPELLEQLRLSQGDTLTIGGQPFTITAAVVAEPDRIAGPFTMGPRIFLSGRGFERAGLDGFGSRIQHRVLVEVPFGLAIDRLRSTVARLEAALPDDGRYRIETYHEAQPALRRALDRLERYLGLVALLSLLVGGIGVGQAVRTWVASRIDTIAVLKCLGTRPREIFGLFLSQALAMGLVGSLVGCAIGIAIQVLLSGWLQNSLPAQLGSPWQVAPLLRGVLLGLGVTLCFSLPPLGQILRVSPARVLRRNAEPLPGSRWLSLGANLVLILGIGSMAVLQSSPRLGLQFTGAVFATALVLACSAWLLTRAAARFPRDRGRIWLRHAMASLGRPGSARLASIVALGLGILVVFTSTRVQQQLTAQLDSELPTNAPSAFLLDIQRDQWDDIRELLQQEGGEDLVSVPVVMARISSIDGRSSADLREDAERGGRRWALGREQRLTYLEALPADNQVVAGDLWSDPDAAELSVEVDFADDLGVDLGSRLVFDIQGIPMEFTVTSLRTVEWESFGLNFFLVAEPGSLDAAPQFRIATARLPEAREQAIQDRLVAAHPNVTMIRVGELLDKVTALLTQLGLGIRFLGGFTAIAGLVILSGSLGVESSRRSGEVALLKTLGMRRRGVVSLFAIEYALIGLVSGVIGASGGSLIAWLVLTQGMEVSWSFGPLAYAAAIAISAVLAVVTGIFSTWRALEMRPIEVLRAE